MEHFLFAKEPSEYLPLPYTRTLRTLLTEQVIAPPGKNNLYMFCQIRGSAKYVDILYTFFYSSRIWQFFARYVEKSIGNSNSMKRIIIFIYNRTNILNTIYM